LDQLDPVALAGTDNAFQPFFSPDGQQVGFIADGSLKRVSVAGGPVTIICPASFTAGASWAPEGVIVFSSNGLLYQVPAGGGEPRRIVTDTTGVNALLRWPEFLPDGKHLLATAGLVNSLQTLVVDIASGEITALPGVGTSAKLTGAGELISFTGDGSVLLTPFDWRRRRTTGPGTPVLQRVRMSIQGVPKAAMSRNGSIAYLPATTALNRLVLVDRHGEAKTLATEPKAFSDPRFSPDGQSVVYTVLTSGAGLAGDIWLLSLKQLISSRLTFEGRLQFPEWTADGRRITFTSIGGHGGMLSVSATGGDPDSLLPSATGEIYEGLLSHDQRTIVYRKGGIPGDLYYVRLDSLKSPHELAVSRFDERAPVLSPEGRWVAYVSNETGREEIFVRTFPGGGARWQVSAAGGTEPRWRRDGRELFYRNADTLFAVEIFPQQQFTAGRRTMLFTGSYVSNPRHATYDVHPNGNQFIFVSGDTDDSPEITLVQNLVAGVTRSGGRVRP
jgi:serine/threonine-protein kinase